jgi:hypothetical protein
MSHKLISNSSVVYNAQTLQSSVLTIVSRQTNFSNNDEMGPYGGGSQTHQVQINGVLFADYGTNAQSRLEGINYTLTETEWNTFYDAQTFEGTESYDKVMECSLMYIKQMIQPMFGLTPSDWTYVA